MHKNGANYHHLGYAAILLDIIAELNLAWKKNLATEEPYHFKPKSIADENQASSDNSDASERLN